MIFGGTGSTGNRVDGTRSYRNHVDGTRSYRNRVDSTRSYRNCVDSTRSYRNCVDGTHSYRNCVDSTRSYRKLRRWYLVYDGWLWPVQKWTDGYGLWKLCGTKPTVWAVDGTSAIGLMHTWPKYGWLRRQ